MSSLKNHEMEAFLARNRELCEGYRHALDKLKLEEDRAALAQELERQEQNAEVDQLESVPDDDQDKNMQEKESCYIQEAQT
jgi:hypothetical protein